MRTKTPKKHPKPRSDEVLRLRVFATSVGDFIRYWGFRRIHGQIWAVLYLSNQAMSGADLTRLLKVSKALVSPALVELVEHGLIHQKGGDEKTRLFAAAPDVTRVIHKVLLTRERQLIANAQKNFEHLRQLPDQGESALVTQDRLNEVGTMIQAAQNGLEFILQASVGPDDEIWSRIADTGV